MAAKVSKKQAEAVLDAIKTRWPEADGWWVGMDGPTLRDADHEDQPEGCWSIGWEGGAEDWAIYASFEIKVPGVHLEAMSHWCLGLYPAGL